MSICAYVECGIEFESKTHNQKYHSEECCRRATNARLMDQYYERKERKRGAQRICASDGCETRLSRYNEKKVCQKCEAGAKSATRQDLLSIVGLA